ncbi:MAG TPA: hypothetical protein VKU85_06665 [bacterium]|nr:hypothetical protein [bacterium]
MIRAWGGVPALALLLVVAARAAPTGSPNAHYHYQIGARAGAAKSFARQLHFEAVGPGLLHVDLAAVNASDLERLAGEIAHWVDAAEAAGEESGESSRIRAQLAAMRGEAIDAGRRAGDLRARLEAMSVATAAPESGERLRTAEVARSLYWTFASVLRAHKEAETALGIPVPEEPPAPESAENPRG